MMKVAQAFLFSYNLDKLHLCIYIFLSPKDQQRIEDMFKDMMRGDREEVDKNDTTIEETAQASEDEDNENNSGNLLISIRDGLN